MSDSRRKGTMTFPSEVQWWIRKDEVRTLVGGSVLSFLQRFDSVSWVTVSK